MRLLAMAAVRRWISSYPNNHILGGRWRRPGFVMERKLTPETGVSAGTDRVLRNWGWSEAENTGGTITWPACASSLMSWHVLRSTVACILRACPYNHRCQMPRNDSNYSSPISRQTFLRRCLRLSFKACSVIVDMAVMGRSYQVIRGQRMIDTDGQDDIDDIESMCHYLVSGAVTRGAEG